MSVVGAPDTQFSARRGGDPEKRSCNEDRVAFARALSMLGSSTE